MITVDELNFEKLDGLIPAIVVDKSTNQILMLGFMNRESITKTIESKLVTFYSRTKKTLWTKGETSSNYLKLVDIIKDCDNDSLLVYALPDGPTCHTGNYSCFNVDRINIHFLDKLNDLIKKRKKDLPADSYTARLFRDGSDRIIQKFGEEAVETVIAAKNGKKEEIINETSDLIFHLLVMLVDQEIEINEIVDELIKRHSNSVHK